MSRKAALAIALVVSSPVLYRALWTQTIPMEAATIRFLIVFITCAVLVGAVDSAMSRRNRR